MLSLGMKTLSGIVGGGLPARRDPNISKEIKFMSAARGASESFMSGERASTEN